MPITDDGGSGGGTVGGGGGTITSQAFAVLGAKQLNVKVNRSSGTITELGYDSSCDSGSTWTPNDDDPAGMDLTAQGIALAKFVAVVTPKPGLTTLPVTHVRLRAVTPAAADITFQGHTVSDGFSQQRVAY